MTEQCTTSAVPTKEATKASDSINAIATTLVKESILPILDRYKNRSYFYKGIEISLSYFTHELAEIIVRILREMGYDAYFCHETASIVIYW